MDHWVKLKEIRKRDKYLDLARELKRNMDMKVAVILDVIGELGTVTKGLVQRLEDLEIEKTSGFGECGVLLYCHHSQVESGLQWLLLIRSYQWVK